ncbi:MAG: hypothetical protein V1678_01325 [Candidatus Aenigmatarchaeota archaeon]
MNIAQKLLNIFSMALGLFLIADGLYFHAITFNYAIFGLQWLNQYVNHWMIGAVFLLLGYFSMKG